MKAQNTANRKENVLVRGILAYFCCSFILVPYELIGPNTLVSEVRTKASLLKFQIYVTVPTSCLWICQAFRKEVVFLMDISGSMKGNPFESAKNGILSSLQKLNPEDSFNIIAFNEETYLFSSLMEQATKEAILQATQWLNDKLTADGSTDILAPLKQVFPLCHSTSFQPCWNCFWLGYFVAL